MQFPHFIIDLTQVKPYWTTVFAELLVVLVNPPREKKH